LNRAFDYQDAASHDGALGREMLLCVAQAGPDGSPLARMALDWLLEMAHERGPGLA
jgi:hypothetical protein